MGFVHGKMNVIAGVKISLKMILVIVIGAIQSLPHLRRRKNYASIAVNHFLVSPYRRLEAKEVGQVELVQ